MIVYIKADKNVEVAKRDVTLGDVVSLECVNLSILAKLKTIKVLRISDTGKQRYVISVLKLIEKIHEQYPNVDVQNLGSPDVIITYEAMEKHNPVLQFFKIILVTIITFVGAAFSIMAFNNDIEATKLFDQIYQQIMGVPREGFSIMELTYSIGVVIGILAFFNHFGKKRFSVDPTPIEVEMRAYENDIQTTLIENSSRERQEIDVGQRNHYGNHRS